MSSTSFIQKINQNYLRNVFVSAPLMSQMFLFLHLGIWETVTDDFRDQINQSNHSQNDCRGNIVSSEGWMIGDHHHDNVFLHSFRWQNELFVESTLGNRLLYFSAVCHMIWLPWLPSRTIFKWLNNVLQDSFFLIEKYRISADW